MSKRKVEVSKDMVGVEVYLSPVRILVENTDDPDLLIKRIQAGVLKEITQNFPKFQCSKINTDCLTISTAKIGMIVEEVNDSLRKGIITAVNNKTINVRLKSGISLQGSPQLYKVSNALFEDVAHFLTEDALKYKIYSEGDAGYLYTNKDVIPVVVGKTKGKSYKLFPINGDGIHFYTLTDSQMEKFFKKTRLE